MCVICVYDDMCVTGCQSEHTLFCSRDFDCYLWYKVSGKSIEVSKNPQQHPTNGFVNKQECYLRIKQKFLHKSSNIPIFEVRTKKKRERESDRLIDSDNCQ